MRTTSVRRAGTVAALVAVSAAAGATIAAADTDSAPASQKTLGAQGYKSLTLGMTEAKAKATGLISDPESIGSCTWYRLKPAEGAQNPGNGVIVSPSHGVVSIQGTESMRTPQGITMGSINNSKGSTADSVRKAYPQYTVDRQPGLSLYDAPAPGNEHAHYRFAVGEDGKVKDMSVVSDDTAGCVSG